MQTRFDRQERLGQAIRQMRRIDLDAGRVRQSLLEGHGLTPSEMLFIEALIEHGVLTVPAVAVRLGVKRQFAQRLARSLRESGLIEATENPRHRRSVLWLATEKGRTLVGQVHARERALLNRHVGDINMTEVIVALRVVNRLAEAYSELVDGGVSKDDTALGPGRDDSLSRRPEKPASMPGGS